MKVKYTIDKVTGEIQHEVLDRQGEDCKLAVTAASSLGTVVEEEKTGPDCDEVHEGMYDGGN